MDDVGTMCELNISGDVKYSWNRKDPIEVQAAKDHFDSMLAKGWSAFKVGLFGFKSQEIKNFDPNQSKVSFTKGTLAREFDQAADYIVTPPVAGG